MWEPHDSPIVRRRASEIELTPKYTHSGVSGEKTLHVNHKLSDRLPPELLILNRFGIGYPYLAAAWRVSAKHDIDPLEVLFRAQIISRDIWIYSQKLLQNERKKTQSRYKLQSFLLDQAVHNLWRNLPTYSAAITWTLPQLFVINLGLIGILAALVLGWDSIFFGLLLILSFFYTANILMRASILAWYDKRVKASGNLAAIQLEELPLYSILVPLRHEANQVNELVEHLSSLNWPLERLEIKLICEGDDADTLAAIYRTKLPKHFELVVVPPALPRTKPKALNYAIPLCRGEFVVIYDAEDRPSKNQLREAYAKFKSSPYELACLQAPLAINNPNRNWLTSMFAIEYHTLFTGILPVLARWRVPLPLGGTSNHFRLDVLKSVGGWDPFNVTEDADLGIRLFREGYRTSTISLPTYEEAPCQLWPWIAQRTRWIKGWMQTILVHNRNPSMLLKDLGLKNTMAFHLLLTAIVISALIHPVFLTTSIIQIVQLFSTSGQQVAHPLLAIGSFNLVAGYTTYGLLALVALKTAGMTQIGPMIVFLPLYWVLISFAGWRALVHLIVKPHGWEKTPHGLSGNCDSTVKYKE